MKLKLEGYDREFGIALTIRKLPMVFPYKYRIKIHIAWFQLCIYIRHHGKNQFN